MTVPGKGHVLPGNSSGALPLLDSLTVVKVASIVLRGNTEGKPAVFDDMIVAGTRSCGIYGIRTM